MNPLLLWLCEWLFDQDLFKFFLSSSFLISYQDLKPSVLLKEFQFSKSLFYWDYYSEYLLWSSFCSLRPYQVTLSSRFFIYQRIQCYFFFKLVNKNSTALSIPYLVSASINMLIELATIRHSSVLLGQILLMMDYSCQVYTHYPSSILTSSSFLYFSFYMFIFFTGVVCYRISTILYTA